MSGQMSITSENFIGQFKFFGKRHFTIFRIVILPIRPDMVVELHFPMGQMTLIGFNHSENRLIWNLAEVNYFFQKFF
jgi:hypothetical protein